MTDFYSPSTQSDTSNATDFDIQESELVPQKKELYDKFILTLEKILPHLGKDDTKIVSALIILALKLEGIIGKDLTEKDSELIEILKECIMNNEEKRTSALNIAARFNKSIQQKKKPSKKS